MELQPYISVNELTNYLDDECISYKAREDGESYELVIIYGMNKAYVISGIHFPTHSEDFFRVYFGDELEVEFVLFDSAETIREYVEFEKVEDIMTGIVNVLQEA